MEIFITILLITGSLVAGASSLYGLKNKLYTESETGRRTLLPTGWISIILTMAGLLITVASGILGYRVQQSEKEKSQFLQDQAIQSKKIDSLLAAHRAKEIEDSTRYARDTILLGQKIRADEIKANNKFLFAKSTLDAQVRETKQTKQILLSGQLLRSLKIEWIFEDSGHTLQRLYARDEKAYDSAVRSTSSHWHGQERNSLELWPLLNKVFKNCHKADGTNLVLIALDDDRNSILSFGNMSENLLWDPSVTKNKLSNGLKVSDGITIDYGIDYSHELTRADANAQLESSTSYSMSYSGHELAFRWHLDPAHLALCIDNQNTAVKPVASLPKTLKIALLYDIGQSPFPSTNFSQPDADPFDYEVSGWQQFFKTERPFLRGSKIQLTVNTLTDQALHYRISNVYFTKDLESISNLGPIPCKVLVMEYERL